MRRNLVALTLIVFFSCLVNAQEVRTPQMTIGQHGDGTAHSGPSLNFSGVPNLCKPCVFYAGDFNANDPNAGGFANGNTLLLPDTADYAPVAVPKSVHGMITGILFMELVNTTGNYFDPDTATYDIRTGVSEGNGGTSVASGSGKMSYAVVAGCNCGEVETAVNLTAPLTVKPGTTYWFNLSPQCTDPGNSNCTSTEFYLPDTTQETNGLNAGAQPPGQVYFTSSLFGTNFANWCTIDDNQLTCARASFGLMGRK